MKYVDSRKAGREGLKEMHGEVFSRLCKLPYTVENGPDIGGGRLRADPRLGNSMRE